MAPSARRSVEGGDWGLQRAKAETEEWVAVDKAPVPVALIGIALGLHRTLSGSGS